MTELRVIITDKNGQRESPTMQILLAMVFLEDIAKSLDIDLNSMLSPSTRTFLVKQEG
jgi:hypothetical protein